MQEGKPEMSKRKGNREARKPKQSKEGKVQAATTISGLSAQAGAPAKRR
jgi:hypothetical protein